MDPVESKSPEDDLIVFGGPEAENIDDGAKSLGEFILQRISEFGDVVCHIDGVTSKELTYSAIKKKSIRYAECMQAEGIQEGDVVALCSENHLEFTNVLFGALFLGATVAPLNVTYTENELDHAVKLSQPKLMFCSNYVAKIAVTVASNNPFIKKVVKFGDESTAGNGFVTSEAFCDNSEVPNDSFQAPKPTDMNENVSLIVCSSGTTGVPKGVQITQNNILCAVSLSPTAIFNKHIAQKNGIILGILPWFHGFGCLTMLCQVLYKMKMVFLPKFEERLFLGCIDKHRVSYVYMVPPLMSFLAKHPLVDEFDLSCIKELLCGAAPLSKEVQDAVAKRLPTIEIIHQGYGMSEMTLAALCQIGTFMKPGSVGTCLPGMYGKIIDPETGDTLGPNQPGEVCFKGSQIMKGYINNEQATKETIDSKGWLHTGDIGYYDEDREFFIVDRLKELIKYKGFQVPPAELEALIMALPEVADVAVVGVPDESSGELPLAFIVLQPNSTITEKEIVDYVAKMVSPAKRLHGGVRFIPQIPKTPSGKILRRQLKGMI